MFAHQKHLHQRITLYVLLVFVMTLGAASGVTANGAGPATVPEGGGDDDVLEFGVEWVGDYDNDSWFWLLEDPWGIVPLSDLAGTENDARGLAEELLAAGAQQRFSYGNAAAWEEDWKGRDKPGGGAADVYPNRVDLAYFSGHGSSAGFFFGVGGKHFDDVILRPTDCAGDWGNGDLDWVGLSACKVLAEDNRPAWEGCMNGVRLLLGFQTSMPDSPEFGRWFGYFAGKGYPLYLAWRISANHSLPSDPANPVVWRVLAEDYAYVFDRLSNHNSPTVVDNQKWTTTFNVVQTSAIAASANQRTAAEAYGALLESGMPVFETPALSLGAADARWGNLSDAFALPSGAAMSSEIRMRGANSDPIRTTPDAKLQMDNGSGMYAYYDQNAFIPQTNRGLAADAMHIQTDDAKAIADAFLSNNGLMPAGSEYAATATYGIAPTSNSRDAMVGFAQETTEAYEVSYTRVITYAPVSLAGSPGAEPIKFPIVGPGAKTLVYVSPQGASAASGPSAVGIMGVEGGFRTVQQATAADMAPQETVPILSDAQIAKVWQALGPQLSLSYSPVAGATAEVVTRTLAYYEHPMGIGQDQLIPVYDLTLRHVISDTEVARTSAYVPANPQFMAPMAILTPSMPITGIVTPGQQLTFLAEDASKTLSELGYDASLNFATGTGDPDSYLYNWYLNSTEQENLIGSGRVLNYKVRAGAERLTNQSIILEVMDSLSPRAPNRSTATYQITVAKTVYLPVLLR